MKCARTIIYAKIYGFALFLIVVFTRFLSLQGYFLFLFSISLLNYYTNSAHLKLQGGA